MADIAKEAGLEPDEPILAAASKVFVYFWNMTWDNGQGTLEGDADALHDMRVAIRRLRTAIQNFEGPRDSPLMLPDLQREMSKHRRKLGRLGDSLGFVRDYDVLQDYLKDYQEEHKHVTLTAEDIAQVRSKKPRKPRGGPASKSDGLDQLKQFLQVEREAVFPAMVKRISKDMKPGALREKFARYALGLPAASGPALDLRGAAQLILPWRIKEVLSCAPHLQDDHDDIGHHEMRKSLRRLRYSVEVLSPCLAEPAEPHLKTLVQLQDYLGEMQDLSVLHSTAFKAFHKEDDEVKENALPADIKEFFHYSREHRRELLVQARDLWDAQQKQNWPQSLAQTQ